MYYGLGMLCRLRFSPDPAGNSDVKVPSLTRVIPILLRAVPAFGTWRIHTLLASIFDVMFLSSFLRLIGDMDPYLMLHTTLYVFWGCMRIIELFR
ncbi:hypothetical protein GQ457_10G009670 [Hibiscus cannabinus]